MKNILTYKGREIKRKGNTIFFSGPEEKHMAIFKILETEEIKGLKVATKLSVELHNTADFYKGKRRPIKKADREGLFKAVDMADVWLNDMLEQNQSVG